MDFSDKELKVLLQALYRFRGEVSGASQSEQHRLELVASIVEKIEAKVGPLKAEKTHFDREMEESLAILQTGKMRPPRGRSAALDKESAAPKVKESAAPAKAKKARAPKATKESGLSKAAAGKAGATKTRSK
jgi:hypothetical protein